MSAGFQITNPNNSIIVDEEHPVYFIPPYSIRLALNTVYEGETWQGRNSDMMPSIYTFNSTVTLTITYTTPVTHIARPLLFLTKKYPKHAEVNKDYYAGMDKVWADFTWEYGRDGQKSGWLNNIVYEHTGVAGRWTGMVITLTARNTTLAQRNSKNQSTMRARINAAMPDFRQFFMPAAAGGSNTIRGAGIMVYDEDAKVIFNSNDVLLDVKALSSTWHYIDRQGRDGEYIEYWECDCIATSPDDWFLVIPHQRVRRYNNEIGAVMMASLNARAKPMRIITGGRSGSPAHTPAMWVRPTKPIPRTLR